MVDWAGLALFVAALAAAFVTVGTFIMTWQTHKTTKMIEHNTNSINTNLDERLKQALLEFTLSRAEATAERSANREERETLTGLAVDSARAATPKE